MRIKRPKTAKSDINPSTMLINHKLSLSSISKFCQPKILCPHHKVCLTSLKPAEKVWKLICMICTKHHGECKYLEKVAKQK